MISFRKTSSKRNSNGEGGSTYKPLLRNRTLIILTALGFGFITSASLALWGGGDLDTDFGVGGKVSTDFTGVLGADEGTAVLEVEDKKIVVVGWVCVEEEPGVCEAGTTDFALSRYEEDGTLDLSFGTDGNGKVTTDFGDNTDDVANAAVYYDDKIIVVGASEVDDEIVFAVARYNEDGSLDTSFGGGDGLLTISFPGFGFAEAEAVAAEDDEIVVAGAAGVGRDDDDALIRPDFAVARLDEDGNLDPEFGGDGRVTIDFSGVVSSFGGGASYDEASAVAFDDEWILVAGFSQACGENLFLPDEPGEFTENTCGDIAVELTADEEGLEPLTEEDFALVRLNEDGTLDTTFGSGGLVLTDIDGQVDVVEAIALEEYDDEAYKIVAVGLTVVGEGDTEEDFALARYNQDGSLDTTFNTGGDFGDGIVVTDFVEGVDEALDVAIMEDDDEYKIVVVGLATTPEILNEEETEVLQEEEEDFGVARYNSDGSLDTTFGVGGDEGDGKVRIDFGDANVSDEQNDKAAGIVISDNDYIIAGHAFNAGTTGEDFAIVVIDGEDEGN